MNSLDYFELIGDIMDYVEDNYEILVRWGPQKDYPVVEFLDKHSNVYLCNPRFKENFNDLYYLVEDSHRKALRSQGKIGLDCLPKFLDKHFKRKPINRKLWEDEFD